MSQIKNVAIIGNGNVAIDVARIFLRKPEDMEKIKKMAAGDAFGGTNGGMPENPMDFLNNSDPAQIKNMLNMVKENPSLMKDMLRSTNPAMADQLTDEQIEKICFCKVKKSNL